jgi:hypothetical protein
MNSIFAYLIDLLIIPLTILSYNQAFKVTQILNLKTIYAFFLMFVFIHFFSSLLTVLSNFVIYGQIKQSLIVLGFGPTVVAFLVLLLITLLPFLKWPFYPLKFIPIIGDNLNPFIMGFFAFLTQILLRKTINDSIFRADQQLLSKNAIE